MWSIERLTAHPAGLVAGRLEDSMKCTRLIRFDTQSDKPMITVIDTQGGLECAIPADNATSVKAFIAYCAGLQKIGVALKFEC